MLLLAGLSAGCSAFSREEPRACPQVRVDAATAGLTVFRDGPGRDLTDVELQGSFAGYEGTCAYGKTGVTVEMVLSFAVGLGPAAATRESTFQYFVALPRYFPEPAAKRVYTVGVSFPANVDRVIVRDEKLSVHIPLEPGATAEGQDVYVGFQLTPEQLEYNRSHPSAAPR
ncbi:hypothetical protein [Pararhodospirillum photometricum]|uniref:hypothetical protein n=1 Tax=Pararhodospirillum photometricum TaxID=1084 RepID=UPI00030DE120|nr:hypothetical protein [Pararhodospirillum photometricum]